MQKKLLTQLSSSLRTPAYDPYPPDLLVSRARAHGCPTTSSTGLQLSALTQFPIPQTPVLVHKRPLWHLVSWIMQECHRSILCFSYQVPLLLLLLLDFGNLPCSQALTSTIKCRATALVHLSTRDTRLPALSLRLTQRLSDQQIYLLGQVSEHNSLHLRSMYTRWTSPLPRVVKRWRVPTQKTLADSSVFVYTSERQEKKKAWTSLPKMSPLLRDISRPHASIITWTYQDSNHRAAYLSHAAQP
jgi:hypothetical protein